MRRETGRPSEDLGKISLDGEVPVVDQDTLIYVEDIREAKHMYTVILSW